MESTVCRTGRDKCKGIVQEKWLTGIITLEHYRLAASIALQKLAMAVQGADPEDDHQENA